MQERLHDKNIHSCRIIYNFRFSVIFRLVSSSLVLFHLVFSWTILGRRFAEKSIPREDAHFTSSAPIDPFLFVSSLEISKSYGYDESYNFLLDSSRFFEAIDTKNGIDRIVKNRSADAKSKTFDGVGGRNQNAWTSDSARRAKHKV